MSASGTLTKRIPSSSKGFRLGLTLSANVHARPLILFVIVVCLNANDLFAQADFREGYLITLSNDSTRGWIKDAPAEISSGKCEFKSREDSPAEIFYPGTINGFGFSQEDRFYESLVTGSGNNGTTKVFAEKLFRGRADLYRYNDFFYLAKDGKQEKVEKVKTREANTGGGRYLHQHKTYIGTLNRYLSDCLPARLLSGDVAYTEKDFVEVFKRYSECAGVPYHQYKDRKQKRRIAYQVFAGFNNSTIEFEDPSLNVYDRDNNFFVGAGVTVPLSFLGDKVSLTAEPHYYSNVYRGVRSGFTPTGAVDKDYIMELSAVKIPVGVKLQFGNSAFTPYLKGGLTALLPLKGTARIEWQGNTEDEFSIEEKTASLVYWAGLGAQIRIPGSRFVFIELRGEKFIDYVGFYGPEGATNIPSSLFNKMFIFGFSF